MDTKKIGDQISILGPVLYEQGNGTDRIVIAEDSRTHEKSALCFDEVKRKAEIQNLVKNQEIDAVGTVAGEIPDPANGVMTKIAVRSILVRELGSSEFKFFT